MPVLKTYLLMLIFKESVQGADASTYRSYSYFVVAELVLFALFSYMYKTYGVRKVDFESYKEFTGPTQKKMRQLS